LARAVLSRAAQGILIAGAPEDASGSVRLWEGSTGLPLPVGLQTGGVFTLAASGKRVAIASGNTVRVIDLDTAKQRAFVASAPVTSLALSPEGSWLATGASDGAAGLWSFDSGEQAFAIRSSSPVAAIALSSATKWIAIAYADARLSVFDAGNGAGVFSRKTAQPVRTLEFGQADVLAVGGRRTEILALPSGLTLATRDLPGDPVALRFTPQDRRLLIALGANIEPWFWDSRQKIVEACERATRNLTPDEWRKLIPEKSYRTTCELPR
jgi:WD40 repeat protein